MFEESYDDIYPDSIVEEPFPSVRYAVEPEFDDGIGPLYVDSGQAGGNPSLGTLSKLNVGPGGDRSPVFGGAYIIPERRIDNVPGTLEDRGFRVRLGYPLRVYDNGIWLGLANVQHANLRTSVVLPDSGIPLPNKLWNISVGTMRIWELDNGWQGGASLNIGSAGDQPFGEFRDLNLTALGFLTVPAGQRDAWNFSIFYSPVSQVNFPIPGIAYVYRPSPRFEASIGIPASFRYRPNAAFTLSGSYTPLTNVMLEARQDLGFKWSVFGRYQIVNDTYWLEQRLIDDEQLFIFDQRILLGLDRKIGAGFRLELAAFYVFDRRIFQAEGFADSRRDELRIEPGPGYSARLIWSF